MNRICPSGDQDGRSANVLEVMLTKGLTILCTAAQSAVLLHPQAVSWTSCHALHPGEGLCSAVSWASAPQPCMLTFSTLQPSHAWLVLQGHTATVEVPPCPMSNAATLRQGMTARPIGRAGQRSSPDGCGLVVGLAGQVGPQRVPGQALDEAAVVEALQQLEPRGVPDDDSVVQGAGGQPGLPGGPGQVRDVGAVARQAADHLPVLHIGPVLAACERTRAACAGWEWRQLAGDSDGLQDCCAWLPVGSV